MFVQNNILYNVNTTSCTPSTSKRNVMLIRWIKTNPFLASVTPFSATKILLATMRKIKLSKYRYKMKTLINKQCSRKKKQSCNFSIFMSALSSLTNNSTRLKLHFYYYPSFLNVSAIFLETSLLFIGKSCPYFYSYFQDLLGLFQNMKRSPDET